MKYVVSVKNLRFEQCKAEYDVRVDRTSPLGNPFYMKDESFRDEVCDKYEDYFYGMIEDDNTKFIKELNRLVEICKKYGKINLFCWCAPKRCHALVIKEYLEMVLKKEGI